MSFPATTDAETTLPLEVPLSESRSRPRIADLALPIAVALWAVGIARTRVTTTPPLYGLPPLLPVVFYLGIALLIASAVTELVRGELSTWRMALHTTALTVMLYGTAPLVYREARYAWLYKHIGVVQYINAHGALNRSIDIYQNWPGFFAFWAWFGRVAGVTSPLAYAKWSQLVVELASLPLLYLAYDALSLTRRQRWLALLLVTGSNWIGQDYFSPQALGSLLSLGLMAIALRWFYTGSDNRDRAAPPLGVCVLVAALFLVLTFTHELSPYILVVQLAALAAFKLLRPRWFPLVLLAIAVAYLAPRFSFVNSRFGLLASIGNFLSNATPPALTRGPVSPSQLVIERCAEALSLGMWALATFAAWRMRRTGALVRALFLLAFTPFVMLGVLTYGHEGVLRVFLFSLPWSAALSALVIVPSAEAMHPKAWGRRVTAMLRGPAQRLIKRQPTVDAIRGTLALGVAVALFIPAFFGDDSFNYMSQADVNVVLGFLRTAPPGRVYSPLDNGPLADTSRYDLFPRNQLFGSNGLFANPQVRVSADVAHVIAIDQWQRDGRTKPAYILITPNMAAYNQQYDVTRPENLSIVEYSLSHSPLWKLLVEKSGVSIYELVPRR
jgi:hypothetical protein